MKRILILAAIALLAATVLVAIGCGNINPQTTKTTSDITLRAIVDDADCGISPAVILLEPEETAQGTIVEVFEQDELGQDITASVPNGRYIATFIAPINSDGSSYEALYPRRLLIEADDTLEFAPTEKIPADQVSKGMLVLIAEALDQVHTIDDRISEDTVRTLRERAETAPDLENVGDKTAQELVDELMNKDE